MYIFGQSLTENANSWQKMTDTNNNNNNNLLYSGGAKDMLQQGTTLAENDRNYRLPRGTSYPIYVIKFVPSGPKTGKKLHQTYCLLRKAAQPSTGLLHQYNTFTVIVIVIFYY
jgi:hypothetical protein